MRAVALHGDIIVFISRAWQTTCTAVRRDDEGFLIDSPVYPDELEALPEILEKAGFSVSGLLATHGDWDHLLGRLAFEDAALGCAESTAVRLAAEPGAAQRELRRFDEEHYVQRPRPLALSDVQALPMPGRVALGRESELDLYPAEGHTEDGAAIWVPWARVLVCGDYLSPVEIPSVSAGGSIDAYLAALERLRPLVAQAKNVVPGHGEPLMHADARRVLEEDAQYLSALKRDGEAAQLPRGRSSAAQRALHEQNALRAASARC
jgi:glyoxylase-like metal-dependent hydrolase (beta-lactamase superfamily II)